MRGLSPEVATEKAKAENRPIELYQVYLDEVALYFAAHDQDVEFFDDQGAPVTYHSLGLSRTPIKTNVETKVDEVTVSLDNVNREMSAYVAHTEINGRRLKIIKVFLDLLDDPDHAVTVFDGIMDAPILNEYAMQVTVRSRLDTLGVVTPRRRYRKLCNWRFGSPECGIDLATVTVTGTVSAIGEDGKTFTLSGRNEAADYFVDGVLTIGGESRIVTASNGASITVDFPFFEAEVGQPYTLRRGCNKSFDKSCVSRFNNGANFGGFLSVPTSD